MLEQIIARATTGKQEERLQWLSVMMKNTQFDLQLICDIMDDFEEPNTIKALQHSKYLGTYARNSATLRRALLEGFESDDVDIRRGCTLALANTPQLMEPRVHAALFSMATAAAPPDRALFLAQLNRTEQIQGAIAPSPIARRTTAPTESRLVTGGVED